MLGSRLVYLACWRSLSDALHMKPPKSILDPEFKWTPPANTDVGRHLKEHLKRQKLADKEAAEKVQPLRKESK